MRIPFLNKAKDKGPALKATDSPSRPNLGNLNLSGISKTGEAVTADNALTIEGVLSCVRVLAESLAALPLALYEKQPEGGAIKAKTHPVSRLVSLRPNPEQTAYEFRFWLISDALLRGCGYAQIIRDDAGIPVALWPLFSAKVKPVRDKDGDLWFSYEEGHIPDSDMLRIQVMPGGGAIGKGLIEYQAGALGIAKAGDDAAGEYFASGTSAPLAVTTPTTISDESFAMIQDSFRNKYRGQGNRHLPLIFEAGMTVTPLSLSAAETQLLESRQYSRQVIAGIFRVPPFLLGDQGGMNYATASESADGFVKFTLSPWLVNMEQRFAVSLLSDDEQDDLFFKFNLNHFLRGDTTQRFTAYTQGINGGFLSPNDVRELEDMSPIPGGNIYFVQGALRPLAEPYAAGSTAPPTL